MVDKAFEIGNSMEVVVCGMDIHELSRHDVGDVEWEITGIDGTMKRGPKDTQDDEKLSIYRCMMPECTASIGVKPRNDIIRHECAQCGRMTQFEVEE